MSDDDYDPTDLHDAQWDISEWGPEVTPEEIAERVAIALVFASAWDAVRKLASRHPAILVNRGCLHALTGFGKALTMPSRQALVVLDDVAALPTDEERRTRLSIEANRWVRRPTLWGLAEWNASHRPALSGMVERNASNCTHVVDDPAGWPANGSDGRCKKCGKAIW